MTAVGAAKGLCGFFAHAACARPTVTMEKRQQMRDTKDGIPRISRHPGDLSEEDLASFVAKSEGIRAVLRSSGCVDMSHIIRYLRHSVRFRISKHNV